MLDSPRTRRTRPSIAPYVVAVLAFSSVVPISLTAKPAWAAPVANADGPYNGCVNVPVQFSGLGSTGNGPLMFEWDFDTSDGIGVDATGPTPSHTYAGAGTYNVQLTVRESGDPPPSSSDNTTATVVTALSGAVVNQTKQLNLDSKQVLEIDFRPNPLSAWSLSEWDQSSTTLTAPGYTGSATPFLTRITSFGGTPLAQTSFTNASISDLLVGFSSKTFMSVPVELRMNLVTGCTVVVPSTIRVKKP